jgi:hypothetical protein
MTKTSVKLNLLKFNGIIIANFFEELNRQYHSNINSS